MAVDYDTVTIEMPSGDTFEIKGNIRVSTPSRTNWTANVGGSERIVNTSGSVKAQVYLGFGTGEHRWRIRFVEWEGSTNQWAGASSSAPAIKKMQILNHSLTHETVDSRNPIKITWGEYSADGMFQPFYAVPAEPAPEFNPDEPSVFSGEIEFLEAVQLDQALHVLP
jgi:hypothetical protein